MVESLDVFLHDERIATIARRKSEQEIKFAWSAAGSSIQLTELFSAIRNPKDADASAFFGGYAPDGNHRAAMARKRDISDKDLFGILREFGGSVAGAITIRDPDKDKHYSPRYDELSSAAVGRRLRQAVDEHDVGGQDDGQSMLPGFQPKLLLARFEGVWLEPHGRAHSTHIIKPQLPTWPDVLPHEYYSHELTRQMDLATFESWIGKAGQTSYSTL